jgi:hypothetical protein
MDWSTLLPPVLQIILGVVKGIWGSGTVANSEVTDAKPCIGIAPPDSELLHGLGL